MALIACIGVALVTSMTLWIFFIWMSIQYKETKHGLGFILLRRVAAGVTTLWLFILALIAYLAPL